MSAVFWGGGSGRGLPASCPIGAEMSVLWGVAGVRFCPRLARWCRDVRGPYPSRETAQFPPRRRARNAGKIRPQRACNPIAAAPYTLRRRRNRTPGPNSGPAADRVANLTVDDRLVGPKFPWDLERYGLGEMEPYMVDPNRWLHFSAQPGFAVCGRVSRAKSTRHRRFFVCVLVGRVGVLCVRSHPISPFHAHFRCDPAALCARILARAEAQLPLSPSLSFLLAQLTLARARERPV
jgi:hypothetical protein